MFTFVSVQLVYNLITSLGTHLWGCLLGSPTGSGVVSYTSKQQPNNPQQGGTFLPAACPGSCFDTVMQMIALTFTNGLECSDRVFDHTSLKR